MAKEFTRAQRVAQGIKKEIAIILQREIKDPRLGIVTISEVEISRDLAYAKVYVTFLNLLIQNSDPDIVKNSIQILQDASGFIRTLLGKSMRLRIVPKLTFFYDNSLLTGIHMSDLVNKAIESDAERQAAVDYTKEE